MENPTDGQDVSQRDLAPVGEEELLSLLVDPETDDFHSWLFDILMDFEFEEDETQDEPREGLLETLVSRCHDAEGMSTETRDFRKNVLKVVLQEAVYKPQAAVSGQDAHNETPMPISEVLQEFMDELSDRRREERMKRIKDIAKQKEIESRKWRRALEEFEEERQDEAKLEMEWQLSAFGSRNDIMGSCNRFSRQ